MKIDVEYYRELCSHPGKFEAEGPETPYFCERTGEGMLVIDWIYARYLTLDCSRLCGLPYNADTLRLYRLELDTYPH